MTGIIHKAADQLNDRIENGNHRLDKNGKLIRVPMNSTELARDGIGITYDKRALGRGAINTRGTDKTVMESLSELKKHFEEMARRDKAVIEAVKTEYTVEENKS